MSIWLVCAAVSASDPEVGCVLEDPAPLSPPESSFLRFLTMGRDSLEVNGHAGLEFALGPEGCPLSATWENSLIRLTTDQMTAAIDYSGVFDDPARVVLTWAASLGSDPIAAYDLTARLGTPTGDIVRVAGSSGAPVLSIRPVAAWEAETLEEGRTEGGEYFAERSAEDLGTPVTWGLDTLDISGGGVRFGRFDPDGWVEASTDAFEYAGDHGASGVALSGNRAAAGWSLSDEGDHRGGSVTTYERACDGTWARTAVLPDPYENELWHVRWGGTVAMWGDLLAVAALGDDDIGLIGWVTVYRLSPEGDWVQIAEILDPAGSPTQPYGYVGFGKELALYGDRLAILSATSDKVYVYDLPTADQDEDGFDDGTDCEDLDADVHPGGVETCNGLDDDCDGAVDPGCEAFVPTCPFVEEGSDPRSCGCGGGGEAWLALAPLVLGVRRRRAPTVARPLVTPVDPGRSAAARSTGR